MALGDNNTYYDCAWTDEYSKFTTEKPVSEEITKEPEETNNIAEENPSKENTADMQEETPKNTEEIEDKAQENNEKENTTEDDNLPIQDRENALLWLLDKIIKFIVKLLKRGK